MTLTDPQRQTEAEPTFGDAWEGRQRDISRRAISGTLWSYFSFALGRVLIFISTAVLARLLVPEQYGLVAYCLIAFQYLDLLNAFGLDVALVSRRDHVKEAANAAFMINLAVGVTLFGVAWALAPALAAFFRAPQVTELFRVLALILPIRALGAVPDAMIQRGLRFRARVVPDLGRSVAKGSLSIFLAWMGFGPWSLIIGQIGGEAAATLIIWALARWRPTWSTDRRVTRELLSFGGHVIAIGFVGALLGNMDYLLIGRVLGAVALGYYTIGYRIPELVIYSTNHVVASVALPLFARLQSDADELRALYLSYTRYMALFAFPAGVGLVVVAPAFVRLFYSSRWLPSITTMQLIAVALAITSIGYIPGVFYKAINRPGVLNRLSLAKLPFAACLLWVGTRWGITGVATAQIVVAILGVALDGVVAARMLGLRIGDLIRVLLPPAVAAAAMGLPAALVAIPVTDSGLIGLALPIAVGVPVYLGVLALVSRETVARLGDGLRLVLGRP